VDRRARGGPVAAALVGLLLALACRGGKGQGDGDVGSSSESSGSTGGEDQLPPAPELASPADGASGLPTQVDLCWEQVEDAEGEAVRYRVFVDDIELTPNGPGMETEGYAGPCTGALTFARERTYAWKVEAFEAEDPLHTSPQSETWTFTTAGDGASAVVFEDELEHDSGWQVGGGATQGAWVRGTPVGALDGAALSQPGRCARGQGCFFTGQNPSGTPDAEDVAGGATTLTSPTFDLSGAAAATVQARRFFYKSDDGLEPSLVADLLVPDPDEPGVDEVFPLERLDGPTPEAPENRWTALEWAACSVPMRAGSRLRFTASDPAGAILEAAVDSVSVHAHAQATVCSAGEGGRCDPAADPACPGELACCAQGVVHEGVYRCTPRVAALDFSDPPESPDDPGNGPLGCDAPDLIVDPSPIDPLFADIMVDDATCELLEGCVGDTGWRTVMLFTAAAANVGARDLALGVAANNPHVFHYSACHEHYHFDDFAVYELRDQDGVVASGHKQAFCMLDTISWAWPFELPAFDCANQGISRGFSDFYESGLPCQWVDVTDVPPGDYTLRIELNRPAVDAALPLLVESDHGNNVLEVPVTVP
jgi:hypothetical protein